MAIAPEEGFAREPEGPWRQPNDAAAAFGEWVTQSGVRSALEGEDWMATGEAEPTTGWAEASDVVPGALPLPSAWSATQVPSGLADPAPDAGLPSAVPPGAAETSRQPDAGWGVGWSQGDAPRALDADQPAGTWSQDDVPPALGLPPLVAAGLAPGGVADFLTRLTNSGTERAGSADAQRESHGAGEDAAPPTVSSWEEVDVTPAFNKPSSMFTTGALPSAAADDAAMPPAQPGAWGAADVPNALVFGSAHRQTAWATQEGVPLALDSSASSIPVPFTPQPLGRDADTDEAAATATGWDAQEAPPAMSTGADWGSGSVLSGLAFPEEAPGRPELSAAPGNEAQRATSRADEKRNDGQGWQAEDAPSALETAPAGWGAADHVPSGLDMPGAEQRPNAVSSPATGPSVTLSAGSAPFNPPSRAALPSPTPVRPSGGRSAKGTGIALERTDADARGDPAEQEQNDTSASHTVVPATRKPTSARRPGPMFPDPGSLEAWDGEGGGNPDVWESVRTADYMDALRARINIEVETQLRADTGMDEPNRLRLKLAEGQASDVVPGLGWSQPLLDVMKLAAAGRLTTDDDGLFRQPSEGSGAGRRVNAQRVQLLLEAGFLAMPTEKAALRLIRPTAQGEQALFLAALYPEGIHPDDGTAYAARLKDVRRPWHNKEDSKSAARRLAPLDRWAMRRSDDRPQRLSDEEHEGAVRALVMFAYDDLERVVARLWKPHVLPSALTEVRDALAAADQAAGEGDRSTATQAFNTAHSRANWFADSLRTDPRGEEATEWIRRLQQRINEYTGAWTPTGAVAQAELPANEMPGPSSQSRTTKPTVPAVPRSETPAPTSKLMQPTASPERASPTQDGQFEGSEPASQPSHAASDGEARRGPAPAAPAVTIAPRSAAPSGPDTTQPGQGQPETAPEPALPETTALPKLKKAQLTALKEVARGLVSRFGGLFMTQTHAVRRAAARSQDAVIDLLELGMVEVNGRQVLLTASGDTWLAHYGVEHSTGPEESRAAEIPHLAAAGDVEPSQLLVVPASIDYSHSFPSQVTFEPDWPRPPAPAPYPDYWYKISPDEGAIAAARQQDRRARERFAHSTARDVAALAIADDDQRWIWTRNRPLAQFDENAAAALDRLTDPATLAYTTQAILNLRAALEEVGRGATEDYLERILAAGSDPAAMDKAWRTDLGVATDPTYATHVRAVVINYLVRTAAHAEAAGLDAVAVVDVLEDAGGWDGNLPQFGSTQSGFPHFPAAESVAQSAQFVASAAREQLMGAPEKVQAWIQQQRNADYVEPRIRIGPISSAQGDAAAGPPAHRNSRASTDRSSATGIASAPPFRDAVAETGESIARVSATKENDGGQRAVDGSHGERAATTEEEGGAGTQAGGRPPMTDLQVDSDESSVKADSGGTTLATQEGATPDPQHEAGRHRTEAAYGLPREATHDWRRLVDAMAALDDSHRTWPRTSRSHVDLTSVKSAVSRIDKQLPAVPSVLPEVSHQLRKLDWMLGIVRDDLARSRDEELRLRLTPLLRAVTEAHGQTHGRTQASVRQLTRNAAGTWLHPWVTELPEGTRANQEARLAHTAERPGRVLHADDTLLQHIGAGEESVVRPARAAGIVDAFRGTGMWQVVRFGDGTHEVVHPALLHPADQDPYPLPHGIDLTAEAWVFRWQAFDRAEAAGEATAALGAFFVVPGDRIRVPDRKGERTVTSVEHGARRRSGRKQTVGTAVMHHGAGTVSTVEYMARDPLAGLPVALPVTHPGLAAGPLVDPSAVTLTQDPIPPGMKFSDHWSARVAGGHEGTYSITGDCRGKVRNGIPDHKTYRVFYSHGYRRDQPDYGDSWTLGLATTLEGATEYVSAHWTRSQTSDHRAEAQQDCYASGLWLLPDVGEGEYLVYRPDGSWELTSREGNVYDIRYEDKTRAGNLEVRHDGVLVGVTTEQYERDWPQMLAIVREHSSADPAKHAATPAPSAEVLPDEPPIERDVSPAAEPDREPSDAQSGYLGAVGPAGPDVAAASAAEPDALFDLVENAGGLDGEGMQTATPDKSEDPGVGSMTRPAETGSRDDPRIASLGDEGSEQRGELLDGGHRPPSDSDSGSPRQAQLTGDAEPGRGGQQEQPDAMPGNTTLQEDASLPLAGRDLRQASGTAHEEGVMPRHGGGSPQPQGEAEDHTGTQRAKPGPEAIHDPETARENIAQDTAVTTAAEERPRTAEPATAATSAASHAPDNGEVKRPTTQPRTEELAASDGAETVDWTPVRQHLGEAGAYADPAAYQVAHEALLTVLDQHEDWLTQDVAAAEAADALVTTSGIKPSALTALLALDASARSTEGRGDAHAAFAEQLRHHVRCTQLTMAKIVVSQATRTTDLTRLRDLYGTAVDGEFIGLRQTTDAGEMEVGQYLRYRADQINQQTAAAADAAETAEEDVTVDEGDDMGLPAIELADGTGAFFSHAAGAPSLHARAVELAGSPPGTSGELAYLDGRPIYVMVTEHPGAADPALGILQLGQSTGEDARTVHITAAELAAVEPARLMSAVTAWMAADDAGARPLLNYGQRPGTAHGAPGPVTAISEAQQSLSSSAPIAETPAADAAVEPEPAQPPVDEVMPAAESLPLPREGAAPMTTPVPGSEPSARPESFSPAVAATSKAEGTAVQPTEGDEQKPIASPGTDTEGAEETEELHAADRVAGLARQALVSLGSSREVTATMVSPDHVLVTVEATGDTSRDQYVTEGLQQALNTAIAGQPDRGLDRFRVEMQRARTGQTLLPANGPAPAPANEAVPRARLIAINEEAARIFASRLRMDPNAELARTYLHEGDAAAGIRGRQIPPEVQAQWGVGYAPSDRSARRWDVLTQELIRAGFSEDELVQSGLAKRSKWDTLYDAFADQIMFPIHNQVGEIVGFGGRRIDRPGETREEAHERGGPKYINTRDTAIFRKKELVFGLYHPAQAEARQASIGPWVGLEGYLDVIAMARAAEARPLEQRPVAGAPMGTALTEDQLSALRGIRDGTPRTHVLFSDNDPSGQRVLLDNWDLLLTTAGTTEVTRAEDVKDAADLWEGGVASGSGGAEPVLGALDQRKPLLDAAVEAQLMGFADAVERANHTFDTGARTARSRAAATQAARLIHAEAQHRAPQDARELQRAALTWAKRLHKDWKLPGHLVATAVLLGPGNHDDDHRNAVYEEALDVLAADPDQYFADDQRVRSRSSAILDDEPQPTAAVLPSTPPTAGTIGTGRWPAGTNRPGSQAPAAATATPTGGPAAFAMSLSGPDSATPNEINERTAAAYALHTAVHERLEQHMIEDESPGQLATPLPLGSLYGIPLATSGADQRTDDPSIVVWLGTDSLRLTGERFTDTTPVEFLAAVEWRAAAAAGVIGVPLSRTWRDAVRTILPRSLPHTPTTDQFAALLDTVAASAAGGTAETRHRAHQAVDLYTAGHPDLAVDHLAAADHIWVLRNDGGWVQETAASQQSWKDVSEDLAQEANVLSRLGKEAGAHPAGDATAAEPPIAADLTIAHHSAHEAMAVLRPYSIGLPGTVYERITDLVAQMDSSVPTVRRLRGPDGERLMGRARSSLVRVLEGLATVAGKIRLSALANRLDHAVARLRGQDGQPHPEKAVRADRRLQDLSHTERDLERRMAAPGTTMQKVGELQEQWIINRARWRARYEQIVGQPTTADFLPNNGLIAGAPPIPNPVIGHKLLVTRLLNRVAEERDIDPHTGEMSDPWNPTADLLTGVAWAYQQRLVGSIPTGPDPEGPVLPNQFRQAALIVTARREASPLTLRRAMDISAERADRLLDRLEAQQILGPYRSDTTRTVLARSGDIDALLARPPRTRTPAPRPPVAAPSPTTTPTEAKGVPETDLNGRRAEIEEVVTKFLAEQAARTTGLPDDPGDQAAPASHVRTTSRHEAQANALTTRQTTQLTPSQF